MRLVWRGGAARWVAAKKVRKERAGEQRSKEDEQEDDRTITIEWIARKEMEWNLMSLND